MPTDLFPNRTPSPRKRMKKLAGMGGAATPIPTGPGNGPVCGHSKCGETCNVRYLGPVSYIRDHHAYHAARGASHIWAATIITGFAIVLTGILAFSSVQAQTQQQQAAAQRQVASKADVMQLMNRIDQLDREISDLKNTLPQNVEPVVSQ